jgi:hypothetical protein
MFSQQKDTSGTTRTLDSLYEPKEDGHAHGPYRGHVMQSSAYTKTMLSDVGRALPFVAAGVVLMAVRRRSDAASGRRSH